MLFVFFFTLSMLDKNFSRQHFEIFFSYLPPENRISHTINLLSAEFAHSLHFGIPGDSYYSFLILNMLGKISAEDILKYFVLFFPEITH